MIKATIQNSPYCMEITFPCLETELSKKLGKLGMNPEHLAPMATVLEIEPFELSVPENCDVSLDALNFLGKRMDGMCKAELRQFFAVLSCDEVDMVWGLKNIINFTDNLARYTLIEDTDDSIGDIADELIGRICKVEKTKELFELNSELKSEGVRLNREQSAGLFNKEVSRVLEQNDFTVSESSGCISVFSDGKEAARIFDNGMISAPDNISGEAYFVIKKIAGTVSEYCTAYEKSAPLKAEGLSENYRCLAEFNGTVLAAKYNDEYGFEFVTWDRTFDSNTDVAAVCPKHGTDTVQRRQTGGKAVCQGNYYSDYAAAKENYATRSGLIDKDKLFSTEELEQLRKCVNFTVRHNGDLKIGDCEYLGKLSEKISENISELQSAAPEMSM